MSLTLEEAIYNFRSLSPLMRNRLKPNSGALIKPDRQQKHVIG